MLQIVTCIFKFYLYFSVHDLKNVDILCLLYIVYLYIDIFYIQYCNNVVYSHKQ